MMNISQQVWDGYFELQKRWMDHITRVGQQTKAYSFEDIDQNIFKAAREIYEKEYQKFLNVPQVGLNRFYQERLSRLTDKYNLFQTSLGEFIYMFYVPIEKSIGVMQEKLEQMAEAGELHDNFKDYYNMWIKVLEGHYMKLLQSPEYTEVMNNTINALITYKQAKDEVMYDILQKLPIPTNKDMDELYKDFYHLKKKVRELSKKIEELENASD
jgi:class III poly(R)-hydroxyalkanoic acid synthase PhaE subunit